MNKLYFILFCFAFVFLNGCVNDAETTTVQDTTTEIVEGMTDVVDLSESYNFYDDSIILHYDISDSVSPSVDILEFIDVIDEGILDFEVTDSDGILQLSYDFQDGFSRYTFYIEFNSNENTIYYNDFDLIGYINKPDNTYYETELQLTDYSEVQGTIEKTINLDDYDIEIILSEGNYYIPLYLANQVLTGSLINVYLNDDTLYIFDDFEIIYEYLSEDSLVVDDEPALANESANFTALLFDHYYGLQDILEIEDFKTEIAKYGLYDASSIESFDIAMQEFIYSLDELHTSIIDFGYHNQDISLVTPESGSRYLSITYKLLSNGYFDKNYTIDFNEFSDFYQLEIINFDLETKDALEEFFIGLDPNKPIFIDLTCNTGGNLIAVYELLSYMTNEPMNLNYYNPETGTVSNEVYEVSGGRALENEFYLYTSGATYSAASLFTSLVVDNDLAIVVGEQTGGGAAAVNATILPNNMIISYSSQLVITDSEGQDIEYGISPDIETDSNVDDIEEAYDEIKFLFSNNSDVYLNNHSTSKDLYIWGGIININNVIDYENFTIYVYDATTDELVDTYSSTAQEFSYRYSFDDFQELLYVEVYVEYYFNDKLYETIILTDHIDDMSDDPLYETIQVPIEEEFSGSRASNQDQDYVQIEIINLGTYEITMYGNDEVNFIIYDLDGESLGYGNNFYLEPGTYILGFALLNLEVGDEYTIYIDEKVDDNLYGTPINLTIGTQTVELVYDFNGDFEWLDLTIPQESLITIEVDNEFGYYNVMYLDGEYYRGLNSRLDSAEVETIVLPNGQFYLKLNFTPDDLEETEKYTVSFTITVIALENDYSGDITLSDNNYGTMIDGENTVTFDGRLDRDIYIYEATESGDILITDEYDISACLITDDGLVCQWGESILPVEVGTNYFVFLSNDEYLETPLVFTVVNMTDKSTEQNMLPITLDEAFTIVIEKTDDFDYYTFSLTTLTTLELVMEENNGSEWYISPDDGTWDQLIWIREKGAIFQLAAGDYVLVCTHRDSFISEVLIIEALLEVYETTDSDPGVFGLDETQYRTITLPLDIDLIFNGEIEYSRDLDVFILEITEAGTYGTTFSGYGSVYVYILIDDELLIISNMNSEYLEVGTYYIVVEDYTNEITDYGITFGNPEID